MDLQKLQIHFKNVSVAIPPKKNNLLYFTYFQLNMTYVLPNDIAFKYRVSLKTVYNQLSKWKSKIRTQKQNWKTFVFLPDFENFYSKTFQSIAEKEVRNMNETILWKYDPDFEKLQNDFKLVSEQKANVEKYNLALQDQVSKYAMLFKEEKIEKQELMQKYDSLQNEYRTSTINYEKEKSNLQKYMYLILWILIITVIFAGFRYFKPNLTAE